MRISQSLLAAAANLRDAVDSLAFSPPVTHVYNKCLPGSGLDYLSRRSSTCPS